MADLKNYREVGVFDLLSAPLNPIGAFDAEQFKKDARELIDAHPDDKFVAVDLMGLDFVYSDAYNAFIQFQKELSEKGGMLALLSNSATIMDGLKKAGLANKLKVFSFEAEMMNFSLHPQEAAEEEAPKESSHHGSGAGASQNGASGAAPATRRERKTGANRRFTKSFNAIAKDETGLEEQGMAKPFEDKPTSKKAIAIVVVLVLVAAGAAAAYFLL